MVLAADEAAVATPHPAPRTSHQGPCRDIVDLAWVQEVREEQATRFQAEVRRRWELLPSGQRIRLLRSTLGWTQGRAASELRITRRTLIRHEQGQHRRPWMRLSLLLRLRELERTYADQILAYLERGGPLRS